MTLALQNIVKAFKKDVVLDGVSLSVGRGETLVLFGPSGAGKTVLLRLIAGVIEPDAGTITIQGRDMDGVEPEDRGIGMAFQNFALFPHMDATDNIAAPLTARSMSKSGITETVGKIARMLKIEHVLHHKPKELSNGQKQRTALARALADPIADALGETLRSSRYRSFFVARQTHAPAVLIEFQYLSNPGLETSLLDRNDYPDKAAQAVARGLERYLTERH